MEIRKRGNWNKLESYWGISQDNVSPDGLSAEAGVAGEAGGDPRDYFRPTGLRIPPVWPWRRVALMSVGLVLAVVFGLSHAWCVNSIHENLLWFSHLTVSPDP